MGAIRANDEEQQWETLIVSSRKVEGSTESFLIIPCFPGRNCGLFVSDYPEFRIKPNKEGTCFSVTPVA